MSEEQSPAVTEEWLRRASEMLSMISRELMTLSERERVRGQLYECIFCHGAFWSNLDATAPNSIQKHITECPKHPHAVALLRIKELEARVLELEEQIEDRRQEAMDRYFGREN